mmetsp:Transcript_14712/g.36671  ORF Transcript_14712/g.36671 Transcript_14712/m.36671 type:complete len:379 (+) Transcript_14712:1478-2614(+)
MKSSQAKSPGRILSAAAWATDACASSCCFPRPAPAPSPARPVTPCAPPLATWSALHQLGAESVAGRMTARGACASTTRSNSGSALPPRRITSCVTMRRALEMARRVATSCAAKLSAMDTAQHPASTMPRYTAAAEGVRGSMTATASPGLTSVRSAAATCAAASLSWPWVRAWMDAGAPSSAHTMAGRDVSASPRLAYSAAHAMFMSPPGIHTHASGLSCGCSMHVGRRCMTTCMSERSESSSADQNRLGSRTDSACSAAQSCTGSPVRSRSNCWSPLKRARKCVTLWSAMCCSEGVQMGCGPLVSRGQSLYTAARAAWCMLRSCSGVSSLATLSQTWVGQGRSCLLASHFSKSTTSPAWIVGVAPLSTWITCSVIIVT